MIKQSIKSILFISLITVFGFSQLENEQTITKRGTNHVELLGKMAKNGLNTMVIFVVQRHDAKLFQPQWKRDPKFGHALYNAWKKGLGVRVIHMKMTLDNIHYLGEIPFELNPQS